MQEECFKILSMTPKSSDNSHIDDNFHEKRITKIWHRFKKARWYAWLLALSFPQRSSCCGSKYPGTGWPNALFIKWVYVNRCSSTRFLLSHTCGYDSRLAIMSASFYQTFYLNISCNCYLKNQDFSNSMYIWISSSSNCYSVVQFLMRIFSAIGKYFFMKYINRNQLLN